MPASSAIRSRLTIACTIAFLAFCSIDGSCADKSSAQDGVAPASTITSPINGAYAWSQDATIARITTDLPTASGPRLAAVFDGVPDAFAEGGVVLADGDMLSGYVISLQADMVTVSAGVAGRLEIPAGKLAAVMCSATSVAQPLPSSLPAGFAGAILANGDRLAGKPIYINESNVGIDTGKRIAQIPRARVSVLIFRSITAPAKATVHVRMANGDRLSGVLTDAGKGSWSIRHALGTWMLPVAAIRSWWNEGPDRMPLTNLPCTTSCEDGFDPPLISPSINQMADGTALSALGMRFDTGIAARTQTSTHVTLDGSWKTFVAIVAVTSGGPTVFRVRTDGSDAFASPPIACGNIMPVAVPVAGARTLSLSASTSNPATIPAYVVWGWTTLVK